MPATLSHLSTKFLRVCSSSPFPLSQVPLRALKAPRSHLTRVTSLPRAKQPPAHFALSGSHACQVSRLAYSSLPPLIPPFSLPLLAPQFAHAQLPQPPFRAVRGMSSGGAEAAPEGGGAGAGVARVGGEGAAAVAAPSAGAAVGAPALVPPALVVLEGVAEREGEIVATVRIDARVTWEEERRRDAEGRGEGGEEGGECAEGHEGVQSHVVQVKAGAGVTRKELEAAVLSPPFVAWLQQMAAANGLLGAQGGCDGAKCALHGVTVQSVDMFGAGKVGFVKFKADVTDVATGAKLPGIVFARGPAVGIFMLLRMAQPQPQTQGDGGPPQPPTDYVVLTEQARVPVGRVLLEMPAGMLDGNHGEFVGTAAKEVKEETGITVHHDHLINLTAFLEPSTGQQMLPSPGGCDEGILLFLYRATVSPARIAKLQGKQTGLRHEGELIKVHVRPLDSIWRQSADCKVLAAVALYQNALKEGLLRDEFPAVEESDGVSSDGE
ncbi:unnamed protein product [Closterium sp. NIES-53]